MRYAILALALVACADSAAPRPDDRSVAALVSGDWRLTHIAGQPLPFTLGVGATGTTEIVAATLTLGLGGEWVRRVTFRETRHGVVAEDVRDLRGTYTGNADTGPVTVRFRVPDSHPVFTVVWVGVLAGNTLTLSGFAEPWRFVR